MTRSLPLLSLFLILFSSCTTSRISEQIRSIQPYEEAEIEGVSVVEYVQRRGALLLASDGFGLMGTEEEEDGMNIQIVQRKPDLFIGTATAIDERGYFLTAAHCVNREAVFLAFLDADGEFVLEQAEKVWVGDTESSELDLALLKTSTPPGLVFPWSRDFQRGDPILSAGVRDRKQEPGMPEIVFSMEPFAGVMGRSSSAVYENVPYEEISHASPLREGNSGGPLLTVDGKLIGINYGHRTWFGRITEPGQRFAAAVRPDLEWLESVMADFE